MRHHKSGRKFNRESSHRKAMMRNLSISLLNSEVIKTTVFKAKELRKFVEPLITLAKQDYNLRNNKEEMSNQDRAKVVSLRRKAFNFLRNKMVVKKLFEKFGPKYINRCGGYTKVLKCGYRYGDKAPMALIQLVDSISENKVVADKKSD